MKKEVFERFGMEFCVKQLDRIYKEIAEEISKE